MNTEALFRQVGIRPEDYDDLHVTRLLDGFVVVSHGDVVKVAEPRLRYCPLMNLLYNDLDFSDPAQLKDIIAEATREKIREFGHFTDRRQIERADIAVPYGASEMMMYAMRKGALDCAVIACDGAGTVVCDRAEVVQGIGARMNGLFYTSPIPSVIERLEARGCCIPFADTAVIDQVGGIRKAAELGHRNIAVTINGYLGASLGEARKTEKDCGVCLTIIVVCATGAERNRIAEVRDHADMVWSCASAGIRELVGPASVVQVSTAIPVFAVTERGVHFLACYSSSGDIFAKLDLTKQYLIAGNARGTAMKMGKMNTFIAEADLPVRSKKEPRPLTD